MTNRLVILARRGLVSGSLDEGGCDALVAQGEKLRYDGAVGPPSPVGLESDGLSDCALGGHDVVCSREGA